MILGRDWPVKSPTRRIPSNTVVGVQASAGAEWRADPGFTDRAAEDPLLHQANGRMPAPAGPEEPAVGGENRTIAFQGEREINAIPQR
jgi:hypothetical protein